MNIIESAIKTSDLFERMGNYSMAHSALWVAWIYSEDGTSKDVIYINLERLHKLSNEE